MNHDINHNITSCASNIGWFLQLEHKGQQKADRLPKTQQLAFKKTCTKLKDIKRGLLEIQESTAAAGVCSALAVKADYVFIYYDHSLYHRLLIQPTAIPRS